MPTLAELQCTLSIPTHSPMDWEQRFWSRVDFHAEAPCWQWIGAINHFGYGTFHDASRNRFAHQIAYHLTMGALPVGKDLDHLCRNRACVNPEHLEPVSHKENMRRGITLVAKEARKREAAKLQ